MRRLVAALLVAALLAVVLTSCGSSETATPEAQAAQPSATPAAVQPGAAVPPGQQPGMNADAEALEDEPDVPREFDATPDTPLFFKQALKQEKPIIVVFFNPDEAVSKLVLGEAAAAYKHYEKSALLFLIEADKNEGSASLAQELGVDFIPYVAAIDRSGTIVFEHTGYIDSKVFELAFYRASIR